MPLGKIPRRQHGLHRLRHLRWPGKNAPTNELLCVGPFTVFPQEFYLYKGMVQNITVNFLPDKEGVIEKKLNLVCENTNLQYTLRGEGIKVDIAIKKLDGLDMQRTEEDMKPKEEEEHEIKESDVNGEKDMQTEEEKNDEMIDKNSAISNDISDDKNEKLSTLFFEDTFPHTSTSRVLVLQNTSSVPIKYHWTIYDVYHQNEFSMLPDDNYFTIEPEDGTFEPFQELSFTIHFTPLNSKIYEQKLDLVIENIPFPAIKQFVASAPTIKNSFTKAEPYLPGFNSSFPSYPLYSFNLHGKGKLPYLEADKDFIDLGDVYLGMEVKETFNISNPKTGVVKFKANKLLFLQSAYFRNMCAFAAPAAENPPHNPDKSPVSHGLFRPDIKSCGEKQIPHNKKNSAAVLSL